jgi:hypothetical protein
MKIISGQGLAEFALMAFKLLKPNGLVVLVLIVFAFIACLFTVQRDINWSLDFAFSASSTNSQRK